MSPRRCGHSARKAAHALGSVTAPRAGARTWRVAGGPTAGGRVLSPPARRVGRGGRARPLAVLFRRRRRGRLGGGAAAAATTAPHRPAPPGTPRDPAPPAA